MAGLQLDNIGKTYGKTQVLDDLSLTIRDGEFLTLLGASGCGKSTLLKLLAGLELPDTGKIHRGDQDLLALSPAERDCAMVFQSYALYPHMTVGGNICTPLYMRSLALWQRLPLLGRISPAARASRRAAQAQGMQVAKALGIDHLWQRKPAQLSGGQRQRVALARAMVRRPSLFLFDEPLSNLDAGLRQALRGEIRQLHQQLGVTFVYVTHDQHEAMSMSDRVAVMRSGRILQLGTPAEIYARPAHREVAALVGSPRMNFITIAAHADAQPLPLSQSDALRLPTSAVELAFRPQAVRLTAGTDTLRLCGKVLLAEFTGSERLATLALPNGERMTAVLDARHRIEAGDQMEIHIPAADWHAFDHQGKRLDLPFACPRQAA